MTVLDRHPIGDMDAESILAEFVADAVGFQATPLRRFVAGLERVARLQHLSGGAEDAYLLVLDRVEGLTGSRRLPITR